MSCIQHHLNSLPAVLLCCTFAAHVCHCLHHNPVCTDSDIVVFLLLYESHLTGLTVVVLCYYWYLHVTGVISCGLFSCKANPFIIHSIVSCIEHRAVSVL